jgi:hypothetical protein
MKIRSIPVAAGLAATLLVAGCATEPTAQKEPIGFPVGTPVSAAGAAERHVQEDGAKPAPPATVDARARA